MINAWSITLIEQTRAVLDLDFAPFGDFVHMKNSNGSYARVRLKDLLDGKYILQDNETRALAIYGSVDDVIAAGWAVD